MKPSFSQAITFIEKTPLSLRQWTIAFAAIVFMRMTIETFFSGYHFSWYFHVHGYFFFLLTYLSALLILRWVGNISYENASRFLTFGVLVMLTPPLIDFALTSGKGLLISYLFEDLSSFPHLLFTFFGNNFYQGITYGVRVEMIAVLLGSLAYVWLKSRSVARCLMTTLFLYLALFLLAVFPSLVAFAVGGLSLTRLDIIGMTLAPTAIFGVTPPYFLASFDIKVGLGLILMDIVLAGFLLFSWHPEYFRSLWRNARFPQVFYHGGLFALGSLLAIAYTHTPFPRDAFHWVAYALLLFSVELSWLASVVVNDVHDLRIDALTNPARPLPTGAIPLELYKTFGWIFFVSAILISVFISTSVAYLLLAYQAIAWMYSADPLRLKRIPLLATVFASAASLSILFAGYMLLSPEKNLTGLPWLIPTFLFLTYTLLLPIKDFKDIEGDRADNIYTLPVILGEIWAKRLIGTSLFILFLSSIFILRLPYLFWVALFFGSGAYWILQVSSKTHKTFPYRFLAGWYVALAGLYGLFILLTVV